MMFSSRTPQDLTPNVLARRVKESRASGREVIDLTVTNPTVVGLPYPEEILAPLATAASLLYRPEPFGLSEARKAVARVYCRGGTTVAPERVVLTSSTSEAYSVLFKLLCDAGDTVLVPTPSYPLFDHLSRLDAVSTATYRLDYHGRWSVDADSVDRHWTERTRAVLAVSPNNPTGSVLSLDDEQLLAERCAERGAALIVDEVFADYLWVAGSDGPRVPTSDGPLTFRLGGLSKSVGLPQLKLGWCTVDGPDALVEESLSRLEIICDAYLSVSTPVQIAAQDLLERGAVIRTSILERIRRNHSALAGVLSAHPAVELLHGDGGWSSVLRIPSTGDEEEIVIDLLEKDGVLVHPGYFFDFSNGAFLVVSLLPLPADFDEGIRRITQRLGG
jgi:aspartate/methionine/tyrosine aminotransferase